MPSIMEDQVPDAGHEEDEEGAIRIGDIYIPPPPLPCLTFDPTGPRLMISDIVIENFKSYGGKVSLGPFQKNFSAIVGPNGSGKSNVIDSMLFVFGYRAQKIRSQTVGVLIHSSDTYPNVTSCLVSVHFQKIIDKEGDDYEVVKDSEFVISRMAYKDNSSYYCINNRKVPFKEVSRMLRLYGIDLDHNRFLILQGEVEQISLMKPKSPNEHDTGMLEFLEDIIGSGRFKEPIELLAKKVEELNELRTEKLKRVKTVEKEKDELEGPKNEAVEFVNWKNKMTVKQHAGTQHHMYECRLKIREKVQKKESIETEQSEFLANFHKIEKDIEVAEQERTALSREFSKVSKAEEEKQTKVNELDILDLKRREDLKHSTGKLKETTLSLAKEKKKCDDLEIVPAKLEEEISALEKRLVGELAKQKMKAEENEQRVMVSLRDETKEIQAEKDVQEQKLMDLQKPVDEASAKMGIAQVELDLYTKNAQNEENRFKEIEAAIEKNVASIQEMETSTGSTEPSTPSVLSRDFQMGEGDQDNSVGNPSSFGDNKNARYVPQYYQLTSAVCHQGSANAGHYVCYGIDNPRQRCKLFDDSIVSEVSKKAASSALKENGYLLIYEKARYVPQSYQLTSTVCHQGSANAGHYVCYGIDNPRQRYKLFDDSNVSEVSKKAASSALKENGYHFIYEKVTIVEN